MAIMELSKVSKYSQLKNILEEANWQNFEEIVGRVFELNDYEVEIGKVVQFGDTKRQYDIIARLEHCIIADCKKWDNKRRIKYGLKKAVEEQIERVKKLSGEEEKYPIIVLSCNTPLESHKRVPIISIYKLNKFLSNFPIHGERILKT